MKTQRSYIVAATMRSGSTLLCDLLANTQVAGDARLEYLIPQVETKEQFEQLLASVKFQADDELKAGLQKLGQLHTWEQDTYSQYVQSALDLFRSSNDVSSVKLMWETFKQVIQRLQQESSISQESPRQCLERVFPQVKFILITRSDKLAQAMSLDRAQQTNQWFQLQSSSVRQFPSYRMNVDYVTQAMDSLKQEEQNWLDFFKTNDIPFHRVEYETLVTAKRSTVHGCLQFLQIEALELGAEAYQTRLQKQFPALSTYLWKGYYHLRSNLGALAPFQ